MSLKHKNRRVLTLMLGIAVGMVGLAYASVPLYRMFCQVTGFGGTPQMQLGGQAPGAVGDMTFKVFFNADTSANLPWEFKPQQREVTVKAEQDQLIAYEARNLSDRAVMGTAVFNITPETAAQYFVKTQCFCFEKQTLEAGRTMNFPVLFYLDPAILQDPDVENLREITLSYTFYPSGQETLEQKPGRAY